MKFGKQLEVAIGKGWDDKVVGYKKLKRLIKRRRYELDEAALRPESQLLTNSSSFSTLDDFWHCLYEDMRKVSKHFASEHASVHVAVAALHDDQSSHDQLTLATRTIDMVALEKAYHDACELVRYAELNKEGFRKIVKKWDKVIGEHTMEQFVVNLEQQNFAGPAAKAEKERVEALCSLEILVALQRKEQHLEDVATQGTLRVRWKRVGISLVLLGLAACVPLFQGHARRCFCLLVFVTSLWISAAFPYFATALMIPPLVVFFRVYPNPTHPELDKEASQVATQVLGSLIDHTSVLLLGGFALSAAFSRFQLEVWMASKLQQSLGKQPRLFVLGVMFLGLFLSMWIGNTTAPVLCTAVLLPVVHDFGPDSAFARVLLIGVAFGCNLGGMTSPIASPQNVIGMMYMQQSGHPMTFGTWMAICVPFCVVGLVVCWLLLLFLFDPRDARRIPKIPYKAEFTFAHGAVVAASALTVLGWATFYFTQNVFGDLGIIALLFIGVVFGSGLLTQNDFNAFPWHMLFLLGGGHVLGDAIQQSGLLGQGIDLLLPIIPHRNMFRLTVVLVLFIACVTTFVSHTVAALVMMPLIVQLSNKVQCPQVPVICCTMAISGAMMLPFSSFPNINSLMVVDDFKKPYLKVGDFVYAGLPCTVVVTAMIITLGYALAYFVVSA